MLVSAHQPAYNPWLGLVHKVLVSDVFVVMDDVQFEKNSFINRNKILQNGNEVMLSVPLQMKNYQSKTIRDMKTANNIWKTKHLKSIKQAYSKAPFFDEVFLVVEKIYTQKSDFFIDYTNAYLEFLVKHLNIETKIIFSSELNIQSKKQEYVIELTKKLGGDEFLFGAFGKEYVSKELFFKNAIVPHFQEYKHPKYFQKSPIFHPFMGVLDLVFYENRHNLKNIILNHACKL